MSQEVQAPFPAPEHPISAPPRPQRSRLGLVLGLGGVGCLGVIALAVFSLVMSFAHAMEKCPPKDFPVYPSAEQIGFDYRTSPGSSDCTVEWVSSDGSDKVATFYDASLASGPWQLTSKDAETGDWYFQRRGDPSTVGRIQFLSHGKQTTIDVKILTGQSPATSVTLPRDSARTAARTTA